MGGLRSPMTSHYKACAASPPRSSSSRQATSAAFFRAFFCFRAPAFQPAPQLQPPNTATSRRKKRAHISWGPCCWQLRAACCCSARLGSGDCSSSVRQHSQSVSSLQHQSKGSAWSERPPAIRVDPAHAFSCLCSTLVVSCTQPFLLAPSRSLPPRPQLALPQPLMSEPEKFNGMEQQQPAVSGEKRRQHTNRPHEGAGRADRRSCPALQCCDCIQICLNLCSALC